MSVVLELRVSLRGDLLHWEGSRRDDGVLRWSLSGTPWIPGRLGTLIPGTAAELRFRDAYLQAYEPGLVGPDGPAAGPAHDPTPGGSAVDDHREAPRRREFSRRVGALLAPVRLNGPEGVDAAALVRAAVLASPLEAVEILVSVDPRLGVLPVEDAAIDDGGAPLGDRDDVAVVRLPFGDLLPLPPRPSPARPHVLYLRLSERDVPDGTGLLRDSPHATYAARSVRNRPSLLRVLAERRPDVLVLATHGCADHARGVRYHVGEQDEVDADDLVGLLLGSEPVPLAVVLVVCHSAAALSDDEGLAARLARRVPVVVGAEGRFPLERVREVLHAVDTVLAGTSGLAAGVRAINEALLRPPGAGARQDWLMASLYARGGTALGGTGTSRRVVPRRRLRQEAVASWPVNLGDAVRTRAGSTPFRLPVPGALAVRVAAWVSPAQHTRVDGALGTLDVSEVERLLAEVLPQPGLVTVQAVEHAEQDPAAVVPALLLAAATAVSVPAGAVHTALCSSGLLSRSGAWWAPATVLLDEADGRTSALPVPVVLPRWWVLLRTARPTGRTDPVHASVLRSAPAERWVRLVNDASRVHAADAGAEVTAVLDRGGVALLREDGLAVGADQVQVLERLLGRLSQGVCDGRVHEALIPSVG